MKAKLDERKAKVLTIITVCFLIILVISASFAYFQAQIGNGASTGINATTGTTDVLTFYNEDLNVASIEKNNVVDNDENIDIVINANEDNFGINGKSLGDGVKAKAKLTANNTNNIAKMQKYNVFIVIDSNGIEYTQGDTRPELIMKVTSPEGNELKDITGLKYHTADDNEPNDISGFDITGRTGGFAIKRDQEIEVKAEDKAHYKEQEWQIEIILINLKGNQNENGGKNVNGRILITTENQDTYELAHINSIKKYETTKDSISGELNYEEGTSHIKEYWYKINSLGTNEPMAILNDEEGYTLSETGAEFDFKDLEENTKYEISSYVVDEKGFKSDIYTTDVFKTESGEDETIVTDKLPIIKEVTVSEMKYNSFKVEVTSVEQGTNGIKEYRYHISGGGIDITSEPTANDYYVFTGLNESQQYKVEIVAIDNKNQESPKYSVDSTETTTKEYVLPSIIVTPIVKANSITFNVNATNGDGAIKEYWYKFNQEQGYTIVPKTDLTDSKKYENLNEKTNYPISIKVMDNNNRESEEYNETIITDTLPTVDSVTATVQGANNLTFSITGTAGKSSKNQNYNITSYSCILKQGDVDKVTKTAIPTSESNFPATCDFTGLESGKEYTVTVTAKDANNNESLPKTGTGQTIKPTQDTLLADANKGTTKTLFYHDGQADYDGMPNADKEAEDDSYRYSGASSSVNNYICLDGKTTEGKCHNDDGTEGEDNLYRIIGLFRNSSNQYEIKVIKSSPATSAQLGTNGAYKTDTTYYWNKNQNESGTDTNKWGESNLNKVNLNTTFKADIEKKIGANKIVEHTWIVGGNTSSNITLTANMKTVYTNEITNPSVGNYATEEDKTYTDKIGLMYASDYGYAASPTNWTTQLLDYDVTPKNSNWMYMNNNTNEWTISRNSGHSSNAFDVVSTGYVDDSRNVYGYAFAARPVFYLASSVTITSGNGSTTNPYRVS